MVKVGVTLIVAMTGASPVLTAENGEISPFPEAARPMEVSVLLQSKLVVPPVFVEVKVVEAGALLQTTRLAGSFTWPAGLTVMVKLWAGPLQLMD